VHGYAVRERDLFAGSIKIEARSGQKEVKWSAEASRELPANEDNCLSKHGFE
jgi:hypothetical protein